MEEKIKKVEAQKDRLPSGLSFVKFMSDSFVRSTVEGNSTFKVNQIIYRPKTIIKLYFRDIKVLLIVIFVPNKSGVLEYHV